MVRQYTHIRIERDTYTALRAVRESMELGDAVGLRDFRRDQLDRVSIDQVIQALIAFRDKHKERRRKSAANRKRRRKAELLDQVEVEQPDQVEEGAKDQEEGTLLM
jgi:hypothetical protein